MYALTLLIPILIVLVLFRVLDLFVLINKWLLIASCLYGVVISLLLSFLHFVFPLSTELHPIVALYIQELLKSLFVYALLKRGRTNFMLDTAAYATAVGLGFCMVRIFMEMNGEMLITSLWVTEAFGTYFAQTLAVVLTSLSLLWLKSRGWLNYFLITPLPAILLLSLSDRMSVVSSLFLLFSFSLIAFKWIADMEAYGMSKKMDKELSTELNSLAAMRAGVFADTPVGRYLKTLQVHFAPEVYLDMICCVRLALELSTWKKSDRLLKMSGFPPLHTQHIQEAQTELTILYGKIGLGARQYLRPIVERDTLGRKF